MRPAAPEATKKAATKRKKKRVASAPAIRFSAAGARAGGRSVVGGEAIRREAGDGTTRLRSHCDLPERIFGQAGLLAPVLLRSFAQSAAGRQGGGAAESGEHGDADVGAAEA